MTKQAQTFGGVLMKSPCWHCLRRTLRRHVHTTPVPPQHAPIRIGCASCGAARDFAVPFNAAAGVEIVRRQLVWIAEQRNRLVAIIMGLVLRIR